MSIVGQTIKSVLIDVSGTLHVENNVINGSVEALQRLRNTDVNIKFVTNTSKESRRYLHERLKKLGFDIQADEIFTSVRAARDLLKKENLKPMLIVDKAVMEDFADFGVIKNEEINSVIIGTAPSELYYENLNKAFQLIMNGAKLVAIHEAKYFKKTDGLSLGPGAFVRGLEYATDTKAIVVGKPNSEFFLAALGNEDPSFAVMIGDDVRDDIAGAQQIGIKGFLVKTGKYREGDENKISPPPFGTYTNFSEVVEKIIELNSKN